MARMNGEQGGLEKGLGSQELALGLVPQSKALCQSGGGLRI